MEFFAPTVELFVAAVKLSANAIDSDAELFAADVELFVAAVEISVSATDADVELFVTAVTLPAAAVDVDIEMFVELFADVELSAAVVDIVVDKSDVVVVDDEAMSLAACTHVLGKHASTKEITMILTAAVPLHPLCGLSEWLAAWHEGALLLSGSPSRRRVRGHDDRRVGWQSPAVHSVTQGALPHPQTLRPYGFEAARAAPLLLQALEYSPEGCSSRFRRCVTLSDTEFVPGRRSGLSRGQVSQHMTVGCSVAQIVRRCRVDVVYRAGAMRRPHQAERHFASSQTPPCCNLFLLVTLRGLLFPHL